MPEFRNEMYLDSTRRTFPCTSLNEITVNGEKIASESWRKKSVGIWRVEMQND
jgi:hypothetical protein